MIAIASIVLFVFLANWAKKGSQKALRSVIKDPAILALTGKIISLAVIGIGIFLALGVVGLKGVLQTALAGAGIAGLAIGMALQGPLSNTFSGISLATKKNLNVGDWISSNGYSGKVIDINLRNTIIQEVDNNLVVLPNKLVLENPIKNFTVTNLSRISVTCGVAYDSDLKMVKKLATQAIRNHIDIKDNTTVEFFYTSFGESSIDFTVRYWVYCTNGITALDMKSEGIMAIKSAFDKHDIDIPFPIRTLAFEDNQLQLTAEPSLQEAFSAQ